MLPLVARSQTETPPKCNASAAPGLEFQTDPLPGHHAYRLLDSHRQRGEQHLQWNHPPTLQPMESHDRVFRQYAVAAPEKVEAELQYLAAALMRR